jgi:hypothetical protein
LNDLCDPKKPLVLITSIGGFADNADRCARGMASRPDHFLPALSLLQRSSIARKRLFEHACIGLSGISAHGTD